MDPNKITRTVGQMIEKLSKLSPDTPIYCMGARVILFHVTGADHDYVTQEEKIKDFEEAHQVNLEERPDYARIL